MTGLNHLFILTLILVGVVCIGVATQGQLAADVTLVFTEQQGPPVWVYQKVCLNPGFCVPELCDNTTYVFNDNGYFSIKRTNSFNWGLCGALPGGQSNTANCQKYPTIKCAEATLYGPVDCPMAGASIQVTVYRVQACPFS